jgi:hypothetical protein
VPGPGAGNIESPGVFDIYAFNGTAGQQLFFDILEAGVNVNWSLADPGGAILYSKCLPCGDPGAFTLALDGTYTIKVGSARSDKVGLYQFKVEAQ